MARVLSATVLLTVATQSFAEWIGEKNNYHGKETCIPGYDVDCPESGRPVTVNVGPQPEPTHQPAIQGPIRWAKHPDKCLDVTGGFVHAGNNVQLWDCHGGPEQRWSIPISGSGSIRWATHLDKCLDVAGGMTHNANSVQMWNCHGGPEQAWTLPQDGQGAIQWSTHPEKCLEVSAGWTHNGNNVQMWDCKEGQQFITPSANPLQPTPEPEEQFVSTVSNEKSCHMIIPNECVFPFKYKDLMYSTCTGVDIVNSLWCSTTSVYDGHWRQCKDPCKDKWPVKKIASTVVAGSVAATGVGLIAAAIAENVKGGKHPLADLLNEPTPPPNVLPPAAPAPPAPPALVVTAAPVTAAPVTAAPVTAAPVTAAPVPVTAAPVTAAPAPVTAAPVTAACGALDVSSWSDVEKSCGPCRALVKDMKNDGPYQGLCANYCAKQGLLCVAQQEDDDSDCDAEWTGSCFAPGKQDLESTDDLICECGAPLGSVSGEVSELPATAAPVTAAPVTAAPVTAAPVTAAPLTAAPVTAAPAPVPTAGPTAVPEVQFAPGRLLSKSSPIVV